MAASLEVARHGIVAEMNVVPLIDILLVLLVIFMLIRPLAQVGLPVELPAVEAGPVTQREPVVVQVLSDGMLRINRQPVQWRNLQSRLEQMIQPGAGRVAFVRGDGVVEFGAVAQAIDLMRAAGVVSVGLLTPDSERGF